MGSGAGAERADAHNRTQQSYVTLSAATCHGEGGRHTCQLGWGAVSVGSGGPTEPQGTGHLLLVGRASSRGPPGLEVHEQASWQSCRLMALAWDTDAQGVRGILGMGCPVCPGTLLSPSSWALS